MYTGIRIKGKENLYGTQIKYLVEDPQNMSKSDRPRQDDFSPPPLSRVQEPYTKMCLFRILRSSLGVQQLISVCMDMMHDDGIHAYRWGGVTLDACVRPTVGNLPVSTTMLSRTSSGYYNSGPELDL